MNLEDLLFAQFNFLTRPPIFLPAHIVFYPIQMTGGQASV